MSPFMGGAIGRDDGDPQAHGLLVPGALVGPRAQHWPRHDQFIGGARGTRGDAHAWLVGRAKVAGKPALHHLYP